MYSAFKSFDSGKAEIFIVENLKNRKQEELYKYLEEKNLDYIFTGPIYNSKLEPCCHLKSEGKVLCAPDYTTYGICWNNSPFKSEVCIIPNDQYENWIETVHMIVNGEKIENLRYNSDMGGYRQRVAVGTKGENRFIFLVLNDHSSIEGFRDMLFNYNWNGAINLDGGGSVFYADKSGNRIIRDSDRVLPFFIGVREKSDEAEKPETEIVENSVNAYSKASDGSKYVSLNFQVREFSCNDGSDPIFVSQKLVEVLQSIRTHFNKPINITSAFRTAEYNAKVGGVFNSQHLYGIAADIYITGISVKEIADYAETLLPTSGGIGTYVKQGFVHIDVRADRSRWEG